MSKVFLTICMLMVCISVKSQKYHVGRVMGNITLETNGVSIKEKDVLVGKTRIYIPPKSWVLLIDPKKNVVYTLKGTMSGNIKDMLLSKLCVTEKKSSEYIKYLLRGTACKRSTIAQTIGSSYRGDKTKAADSLNVVDSIKIKTIEK